MLGFSWVIIFLKNCVFVFLFSESSSTFTNYDSGFARENIRLEKDVLSKLGVRYRINYFIYSKKIILGYRSTICFSDGRSILDIN
jgi:hypothetical protein